MPLILRTKSVMLFPLRYKKLENFSFYNYLYHIVVVLVAFLLEHCDFFHDPPP